MSGTGLLRHFKVPRGLLADRVNIEAPTRVADGQGGFTTTWSTIATSVPTYIGNRTPSIADLQIFAGGLAQLSTHRLWFRDEVPGLNEECRVLDPVSGKHFRINSLGQYAGSWMALCEEFSPA